jgi:hypothetical protein
MSILKNKIAISKRYRKEKEKNNKESSLLPDLQASKKETITQLIDQPKKRRRVAGCPVTTETDRATKNIVKNYGKAICSFASSPISTPYLEPLAKKHGVEMIDFINFVSNAKESIESMSSFRNHLLITEEDDELRCKLKQIFRSICEVFIKFFSVNWIFSGRLTYKEIHLKFRFKLLRRVRNPESFTYLSARAKKEML